MPITPRCHPSPSTTRQSDFAQLRALFHLAQHGLGDALLLLLPGQVELVQPGGQLPRPRRRPSR